MKAKNYTPLIIASTIILMMVVYFLVNPSYEKSLRAKYHYTTGDYEMALSLAQESFNMDLYNRMAATIMAQSKASIKYTSYIYDAKDYLSKINTIAKQEFITDADKAKIRTMCKIMISSYNKLAPSVVIDTNLLNQSKKYKIDFEKLLEKVNH